MVVQVTIDTAGLEDLFSNDLPTLEPATDSDPDAADSLHINSVQFADHGPA